MGGGTRLPGMPAEDAEERIVLHVDMDCFYAACERLREPALIGEPVVVGMGYEAGESSGAVATASYEAREYGVESAQAIGTALERLPRMTDARSDPDRNPDDAGYYRPVDMDFYESVSEDVRAILHACADVVREVSIDEAYLDVTDRTSWGVVEGFARHVKNRIERDVGVTASIGVAPNMSAAKIASDHDKPDGLVVVPPGSVREFLSPLPVEGVHGIGPVTARELRKMGVETAGDLAETDPETLEANYGDRGIELRRRARGEDDREVTPTGDPKSFSRESAFSDPTTEIAPVRDQVSTLAEAVADRASRNDALYRTIGIKVVTPPYDVNTRERSLPGPVDEPALVEEIALELLSEFDDEAIRKVGVRVSNLSFAEGDQANLSNWDGPAGSDDPRGAEEGTDNGSEDSVEDEKDDREESGALDDTETVESRPGPGQTRLTEF